jgi:hypothetical protein
MLNQKTHVVVLALYILAFLFYFIGYKIGVFFGVIATFIEVVAWLIWLNLK